MSVGSISLLIDSPLTTLAHAMGQVPSEVRKQIGVQTKSAAQPIWTDETRGRALTRLQQRALVDTAKVDVTTRNVFLRSGGVGKLSTGTPVQLISGPAEFGMNPAKVIRSHTKRGTVYTRRAGDAFGLNRRTGNVVYPAAYDSIPRFASLWVQTAIRTILDAADKAH